MTTGKGEVNRSNLAQYRRVINTIISGAATSPYLLLDGFLHTENCSSLWRFDSGGLVHVLEITNCADSRPCISLSNSGVEIYLFWKMEHAKLRALNERLGWELDRLPDELNTLDRPLVDSMNEHLLLTTRRLSLGNRTVTSLRDPDLISVDQKGMTKMLSSLQPALEARARGVQLRQNTYCERSSGAEV